MLFRIDRLLRSRCSVLIQIPVYSYEGTPVTVPHGNYCFANLHLPSAQADVMLVKNAENLMQAVIKTVQAAESACMKVNNHTDSLLIVRHSQS